MSKKTILITGGSGGIGAEAAKKFAAEGCKIILSHRHGIKSVNVLKSECRKLGAREVNSVKLDLTNVVSINRFAREVTKLVKSDPVDVFINCAGVLRTANAAEINDNEAIEMVWANLLGPILLFPRIAKFNPRVSIFIGSDLAKKTKVICSAYSATKWGMRGYVKTLAKDGFNVLLVNPDTTSTAMTNYQGREPEVVASAIFAISQDGFSKPSGSEIDIWKFAKSAH
jgi:3-oxoacyl-[acyl-carrier protein] reductase